MTTSNAILIRAILQTIAYADVFDSPLTAQEVHRYLTGAAASLEHVQQALDELSRGNGPLLRQAACFMLRGREQLAATRTRRTGISMRLWPLAVRYGRWIAALPFVRMVAVTGSLAVNNVGELQDLDYLIVTVPDRLWTSRALSMLVVRLARLRGVQLCPNYLITEHALELPDRSLYAAHELAQMIPLSGLEIYARLRQLNLWSEDYLPNATGTPDVAFVVPPRTGVAWLQRALEFLLNLLQAGWFERWEMRRKIERFVREPSSTSEVYFSADVCKGHFDRHASQTAQSLQRRLESLALEFSR